METQGHPTRRSGVLTRPKLLTVRSVIVSTILGFLLNGCTFVVHEGMVRPYHTGQYSVVGEIRTDDAGELTAIDYRFEDSEEEEDSRAAVGLYTYWDSWSTALGFYYPIVERYRTTLTFYNADDDNEMKLSSKQMTELRRQIAALCRKNGDDQKALHVLQPDRTDYKLNWSGLMGNVFWLALTSLAILLFSYSVRVVRFHANPEVRRMRAILAHRCPNCGYDTRLLPQPRCPECGEVWEVQSP